MLGQPVRCPACSKFFQVGPAGAVPVAAPPAPPALPTVQVVPYAPPAATLAPAAPDQPDELERFDTGGDTETKFAELRLETVAKGAADNLILAGAANVLAAFVLGLGTLLANKDSAVLTALLFLILLAWLLGVTVMVFGALQLKQLRMRPYVYAAAYAALGVGSFGILCSFVCAVLMALMLVSSSFSANSGFALVSYGFNAGPVVYLLVFGVLIAAAVFTIYAGSRTLQALKDPQLDAALR
jgi:hypothetical protein